MFHALCAPDRSLPESQLLRPCTRRVLSGPQKGDLMDACTEAGEALGSNVRSVVTDGIQADSLSVGEAGTVVPCPFYRLEKEAWRPPRVSGPREGHW